MIATVTNVACAYIQEAEKFIDSLRYGINCHNDAKLLQLERDYFMIKSPCDTVEWCYNYLAEESDCSIEVNCEITIDINTPTITCPKMGLTLLN